MLEIACSTRLLVQIVSIYTEFYSNRGGEFAELSAKKQVKTVSYHPEANGKIARNHKEPSMMWRLYETEFLAIAELWRQARFQCFQMKTLRQVGDLILRYVQKSLNMGTMKTVYVHLNNLG
jgi:hypothetical protein